MLPAIPADVQATIDTILAENRIMTVATLRPDGWPQATTVGFVSDGRTIYFLCGRDSQKAANLARDDRLSATIDRDAPEVDAIRGLSIAAHAEPVTDAAEIERMLKLLAVKYPEYLKLPPVDPAMIAVFRLRIEILSVLDYRKGFGHTDLIAVPAAKAA